MNHLSGAPNLNVVSIDLTTSDKALADIRTETLHTTHDLIEYATPDLIHESYLGISTVHDMTPEDMFTYGHRYTTMSVRNTTVAGDESPQLNVRLRGSRHQTSIDSLGVFGSAQNATPEDVFFDTKTTPSRDDDPTLIDLYGLCNTLDSVLPDCQNQFSELCDPRANLTYSVIAEKISSLLLPRADTVVTEQVYTSKEQQITTVHPLLKYGARLVVRTQARQDEEVNELVRLTTTHPLEVQNGVVWKQFTYEMPLYQPTPHTTAKLTLMSPDVSTPELKRYARHAWRQDNIRMPAQAALEAIQHRHLGFAEGDTYTPL